MISDEDFIDLVDKFERFKVSAQQAAKQLNELAGARKLTGQDVKAVLPHRGSDKYYQRVAEALNVRLAGTPMEMEEQP